MSLFKKKFTIVIVCKANITRSAYLHGYIETYLRKNMPYVYKKVKILSAGVKARTGSSAHQVVKHVAKINGFDLKNHSSNPITEKIVKKANIILVMEQWQKENILTRFKNAEGKTFCMMEYLWTGEPEKGFDIPDPTGQKTEDYKDFIEVAHNEVERIFRELSREGII